jgi:RND family efflux transporter MFP subunit
MNYETSAFGGDEHLALPDGTERPSLRKWIIIAVIAVVVLLGGWYAFHAGKKDGGASTAQASDPAPVVTVIQPGVTGVQRAVSGTGSLAARVDMPVGVAGEGGRVTAVLVQPGDWVKAGQVLATVDRSVQVQTAASLSAQIAVAQADEKLAQANLDRAKQLVANGFISKSDIDTLTSTRDSALAKVHVAEAQLAEQRATNGRLDIRAPAAGLVLTRQVEPGQIVSSGSGTLFRMAKDGEMELKAQLSQSDLSHVPVGASAQITPVGSSQSYAGHVWQVEPVIDPQSRQGVARIAVPYTDALRPGGFAAATIEAGTTQAPQLPNSALLSDDNGNFVYVIKPDNTVERRNIRLGIVSDTGAAIASGLTGQERVVLSAGAFLNPGQKVKPVLQKAVR